ncbi:MAG TPA: aldo/keto reductase [Chloroflexi bacterium]|nr:aldo/keto reductase [Chloroflexota bacterium]HBY09582.1 aldo/keto reductase [Chloroflexota bacterium]
MHYRRLGKSGLKVSEISLGSWVTFGSQLDEKAARQLIHAAYNAGVNFFDNADVYADGQAEVIMGQAIKDLPREALVLSSKVFWPTMPGPNGRGLSRKHITESIHASLRRLGTDYLDLYFCHRFDPDTPVDEVVFTMNHLIQQGKILYWGTSEWSAAQISLAYGVARQYNLIPPSMEQPQYNMFQRKRFENEIAPLAKELGIGLTTFSPLYFGILTGKYNDGIPEDSRAAMESAAWMEDYLTPERLDTVRLLEVIAADLGITLAQLALAWILRRKEISSVITGATKKSQLQDNLAASEAVTSLTDDVLAQIDEILGNHPLE